MKVEEIREILELVREHALAEFEFEREGMKIRIKKELGPSASLTGVVETARAGGGAGHGNPGPQSTPVGAAAAEPAVAADVAVVKSPIVGTFYRAPEPGAPPFVELGQTVKKGHVLCLIEAMKLMNQIDAENAGEIVDIYVENGQPVQYGDRLMAIRPTTDSSPQ